MQKINTPNKQMVAAIVAPKGTKRAFDVTFVTAPTLSSYDTLGDNAILQQHKTAFLCSRQCPAMTILKIYEWAQNACAENTCVLSGFHTTLERDVWKILIQGEQPLIEVCARGLPKRPPAEKRRAIDNGRLLIISPFAAEKNQISKPMSHSRNVFILSVADAVVIGAATPQGRLAAAVSEAAADTTIRYLD